MNTNRYSFDDRFGDDLFELIISYLPIEDKLKYESVSKRFQRFVFSKQKVLRFSWSEDSNNVNEKDLITASAINVSKLTAILKKFKFIDNIEIDNDFSDPTEVMNTITEYCNHLTAIRFAFNAVNSETLKKFFQKFGQQLRRISFTDYPNKELVATEVFHCLPNLSSISGLDITDIENLIVLPKKVVKIGSLFLSNSDQMFKLLSNNKSLHLKHLEIEIQMESKPNINCFEKLSQLKNLEVLKIRVYKYEDLNFLLETIQSFATNCLNLQYFSFEFDSRLNFNAKHYLETIAKFSALKMLSISTVVYNNYCDSPQSYISDLIPLKNCENLLALYLRIQNCIIREDIFDGIHLIVPKLRQLSYIYSYDYDIMTDKALESMAKLKHLTHLKISAYVYAYIGTHITFKGIQSLITGCKRFKSLRVCGLYAYRDDDQKVEELKAQHKNIDFRFDYFYV